MHEQFTKKILLKEWAEFSVVWKFNCKVFHLPWTSFSIHIHWALNVTFFGYRRIYLYPHHHHQQIMFHLRINRCLYEINSISLSSESVPVCVFQLLSTFDVFSYKGETGICNVYHIVCNVDINAIKLRHSIFDLSSSS